LGSAAKQILSSRSASTTLPAFCSSIARMISEASRAGAARSAVAGTLPVRAIGTAAGSACWRGSAKRFVVMLLSMKLRRALRAYRLPRRLAGIERLPGKRRGNGNKSAPGLARSQRTASATGGPSNRHINRPITPQNSGHRRRQGVDCPLEALRSAVASAIRPGLSGERRTSPQGCLAQ